MPATEEISEPLIRENITRALADVFKTMVGTTVTPASKETSWPPTPPSKPEAATAQVVGTVGFIGEANGLIYIYFDAKVAAAFTGILLGMSEAEVEECGEDVVNDAVGELTNMIVGVFKNGVSDAGYTCRLTVPSILRGRNFSVEPISSARRHIYAFECLGRRVVADILMAYE